MKDKLYVFCHIPKTGGVTFINLMEKNFEGRYYHFSPGNIKYEAYNKDEVKFIHGHFDIEFPERSGYFDNREIILFTFLREPISRSLSYYDWSDKGERKWNFTEFFENTYNCYKGNTMTKFLSGISVSGVEVTEEDYERALKNLKNVNIGFTEEYEESLKKFANNYPEAFKSIDYIKTNQSSVKYKPGVDDIKLLEKVNYFDIRLYNEIRRNNER